MDGLRSFLATLDLPAPALARSERLAELGKLFVGWPLGDDNYLVNRLTYWPEGVPSLRATAIVSSRLGRALDRQDELFRVLRLAMQQLDPRHQMLLCAEGTTASRFVARAGQLFGISVCHVRVASARTTLRGWTDLLPAARAPSQGNWRCYVSPPLRPAAESLPLRDRIEVSLADQVLALHLRKGGTLWQLLADRLSAGRRKVFLALGGEQLVQRAVADEVLSAGAVGWIPLAAQPASRERPPVPFAACSDRKNAPIIPLPPGDNWPYLTHCTRRAHGHWPDQPAEEFLDELILGKASRDRSCLAALMRILGQQSVLATGAAIRGNAKVVSFTGANLDELPNMRAFRSHRGRWDFEPYGICIHREKLRTLGVRPVQYGSEQLWRSLSAEERPFFQKTTTREQGIDWRVEQEWRCLGDLDLTQIGSEEGLAFVPSRLEAEHVARLSPWPVTVLTPRP